MPSSTLLTLPAELRAQIYTALAPIFSIRLPHADPDDGFANAAYPVPESDSYPSPRTKPCTKSSKPKLHPSAPLILVSRALAAEFRHHVFSTALFFLVLDCALHTSPPALSPSQRAALFYTRHVRRVDVSILFVPPVGQPFASAPGLGLDFSLLAPTLFLFPHAREVVVRAYHSDYGLSHSGPETPPATPPGTPYPPDGTPTQAIKAALGADIRAMLDSLISHQPSLTSVSLAAGVVQDRLSEAYEAEDQSPWGHLATDARGRAMRVFCPDVVVRRLKGRNGWIDGGKEPWVLERACAACREETPGGDSGLHCLEYCGCSRVLRM